jgi:hypothetical protein
MKQTIIELIVYSFQTYSNLQQRATYISGRMTQIYNKNNWSCVIGRINTYYGASLMHVKNVYYSYRYKYFDWIIFIGNY